MAIIFDLSSGNFESAAASQEGGIDSRHGYADGQLELQLGMQEAVSVKTRPGAEAALVNELLKKL